MRDSLLACLIMIVSSCPSLDQKEEMLKFLLAVIALFKAFKKRVPSKSFAGKRPLRACASTAKSVVLSELSGLENVLFNDFIESSTMCSTQKTCQSRGLLPLCQILFQ
jgi:hypothetical protein